jgi:hypothetical protein
VNAIVKLQPAKSYTDPREAYILRMWIRFLLAPARPSREELKRGAVTDLGELGSIREKNWTRATPYSLARPE